MLTRGEMRVLRIIYEMEERGIKVVGPSAVAGELGISRPSAYETMRNLQKKGYLIHVCRKGFTLSDKGRQAVKRILRNHRVLEVFIVSFLGFNLSKACKIAFELEYSVPAEMIEALHEKLGRPRCCPHGKPIPEV